MQLDDLLTALDQLAPLETAEAWDNVGLLLGDRSQSVTRVLTCLTLTPDVAAEAIDTGCQLIVTHHPVLFKPIQRLTSDSADGRLLLPLLRHGIAVYSPHTAWDNAPRGINQQLAERLGLQQIRPLRPWSSASSDSRSAAAASAPFEVCKLVTFVPVAQLDGVQQALWSAGCGVIGDYSCCSYRLEGAGTFFGGDHSNPQVGMAGRLETVAEVRLEVVCPAARLSTAITALRAAHPYEEPAFDVYPLWTAPRTGGSGRYGVLTQPLTLEQFAAVVEQALPGGRLEIVGDRARSLRQIGIACGSAGEFWKDARRAGCDLLLTGETRFHTALEAREAGFALLLAGHFATEHFAMGPLATQLAERCPGVSARASQRETNPLFVPSR